MKNQLLLVMVALAALLYVLSGARAQTVPAALNYQGQLVDDTGQNLPDGNHTVAFRLYSVPMGGAAFWGPATQTVTLVNGRFNTQLDADDTGQNLGPGLVGQTAAYLELAVDGNPAITPRQQLLSAPYALYAGNVVAGAIGPSQLADQAVTSKALSPAAVTSDKLAAGAAVVSVSTGPGLKGGPITSAGAIALDLGASNRWTSAQSIETATAGLQLYLAQDLSAAPAGLELSLPFGQPWDIAAVPGVSGAKLDFSMGGKSMMSVDENGLLTAIAGMYGLLAVAGEQVQTLNVLGTASFQGGAGVNGVFALGWGTPISVLGYNNTNLLRNGSDGVNDYVSITVPGNAYPAGKNPNGVMITASGSVGINKTTPQHALDVAGDLYASGSINGLEVQNSRGVGLSAANSPIITRGWDPFDQTAGAQRQGLGRWGLFMEPYTLVVGIPGNDRPGRKFEIAKYDADGIRSPLLDVDQTGAVSATSFNPTSDRAAKENFTQVDPAEILAKVLELPLSQWNFKQDPAAPHLGPVAQDFHAAFGLGRDDKHIATVDADGVALAAIQGLDHLVETQRVQLAKQAALLQNQQAAIMEQQEKISRLERKLADLEERLGR